MRKFVYGLGATAIACGVCLALLSDQVVVGLVMAVAGFLTMLFAPVEKQSDWLDSLLTHQGSQDFNERVITADKKAVPTPSNRELQRLSEIERINAARLGERRTGERRVEFPPEWEEAFNERTPSIPASFFTTITKNKGPNL